MGGDNLTILLFFGGTGIAGVIGALSTTAWRSKTLWGVAVICAVGAIAYWRFATSNAAFLAFRTIWALIPFVALAMCVLVVGDREPRKRPPKEKPKPPTLNPALTADYFYGIVGGATELEAKRKFAEFKNQLARLKGEVVNISDEYDHIGVKVLGVSPQQGTKPYDYLTMDFRKDQADALSVIKPGDWIEFTGQVAASSTDGWRMFDCEFVGRAAPPPRPKPRTPRKKAAPKAP